MQGTKCASRDCPPPSSLLTRVEALRHRVASTLQRFGQAEAVLLRKLGQTKEECQKTAAQYSQLRQEYDKALAEGERQEQLLYCKFKKAVEHSIVLRKELENKLYRHLECRLLQLASELGQESEVRGMIIADISASSLEHDLPKLEKLLVEERKAREARDKQLLVKLNDDLKQSNDELLSESRQLKRQEDRIFDMIKQMANKIRLELEEEEKQRVASHDSILGLVEQACNKLLCTSL